MKPAIRLSGSLITRLFAAFLLLASTSFVTARIIPCYPMDSLTFLSDIVVYCQEESVKTVSIKHANYTENYTSVKCRVLRAFKGDFKPGSEITVNYNDLFGRNPSAGYLPPQKYDDLPLRKALVFLNKNKSGAYDVLDAKLVQKDAIYRYIQRGNPGGLGLARQGPENITLPETQGYDERALLQDMTLAVKKSQSLKAPVYAGEHTYANGFAYDDPADDAIAGMAFSTLKASSDYLIPTSKERELKSIESDSLNAQYAAEQMENALAIPGDATDDPSDPRRQQAHYAADLAAGAKDKQQDMEMWLERNCRQGCRLYLYQYRRLVKPETRNRTSQLDMAHAFQENARNRDTLRNGYCIVKDGTCVNSLVLVESWLDPREAVYDGKKPSITILTGNGQTTAPGEVLSVPLMIELKDSAGKPIANAPLRFQMENNFELKGGGLHDKASTGKDSSFGAFTYQMTDTDGRAQAFFRQPFRSNCKSMIIVCAGTARAEFTETTLTDEKPPTPPGNIRVTALDNYSVYVEWKDYSDNATGFVIQRSNDKKTWFCVGAVDAYTTRLLIPSTPENIPGLSQFTVIATSPYIDARQGMDKAIADYSEAILLDPKDADAYNNRGIAYGKKGEFDKAIEDHIRLTELEANSPRGYNEAAWIYATCAKDNVRNGAKAVEFAKKACELSQWNDGGIVDTLAAAEAEAGQFDEAVKYQQQAINLVKAFNASADTKRMEDRASLYQLHKPYREIPE
ncbi:MAG: tetratricopeptide repeat protein [Chthoniobacteraceae bacterium]